MSRKARGKVSAGDGRTAGFPAKPAENLSNQSIASADPNVDHLVVRAAEEADRSEILALRKTGAEAAFASCGDDSSLLQRLVKIRTDPNKLTRELAEPECHVLVASSGNRVVGTAMLVVSGEEGELAAAVSAVGRRGIGSALMRARISLARELGLKKVWLETDTVNPHGIAHAVRHGFVAVADRPGATIPHNHVIRYELSLRVPEESQVDESVM